MFVDADMLALGDVADLFARRSGDVAVVKNRIGMEWCSMMLFDNERCKVLTPSFVEDPKNALFDLKWAKEIGDLPSLWNHCVGYDVPRTDAKLVHFTQGIPFHSETEGTEYVDEWRSELESCVSSVSWHEMMGNSVHAEHARARLAAA